VAATSSRIEGVQKCMFYLKKNNFLIFWDKRNFNKCDFFRCDFCQRRPLMLLAPGVKNLSYAAVYQWCWCTCAHIFVLMCMYSVYIYECLYMCLCVYVYVYVLVSVYLFLCVRGPF